MTLRASKPAFNVREKLTELGRRFGLKGSELAAAETAQDARDLVSAGRKNILINGSMAVAQRGTSVVADANGTFYGPDRFGFHRGVLSTTITGTQQTVTDLPGHTTSFRVTCSGNATLTNNSDCWIRYMVEDKNFARINWKNGSNKFVTLSFWAKSNRTGQFSFSLNSGSFSVAKNINTFTLDEADTWKKITYTYPAPSTFTESNNIGARIYWGMGTGTTYYTSNPNIGWLYNNSKIGAVGDTQIYGDDGAYFEITGVQLEEGKNATDFEYRSYGEELALCQRYYLKTSNAFGTVYESSGNTGNVGLGICFPVEMRVAATNTITSLPTGTANNVHNFGAGNNSYVAGGTYNGTTRGCQIYLTGGTARSIGTFSVLNIGAEVSFNAEW